MKRVVLLICWLGICIHTQAYTERNLLQKEITIEQLKEALIPNQKWVSYPAYTNRDGWDKFMGEYKTQFIRAAEKKLHYEWKVVPASAYLEYERTGNRRIMEDPFGENNNAIATFLIAELAEGKGRFMDQLINGVYYACEMTSWALSAHLTVQHSRRSLPDYKEHIIELTSGDLASMLAWTYYFFHHEFDKINPVISERLRSELKKRIMEPYMKEDRFWWMAFNLKPGGLVNNWNPWCNSNVLQCFLLLEQDKDNLAKAVYRTMVSVDKFINYVHTDGACEEGPSYWGHAAGKLYDYLRLLFDATGGRVSLFDVPMIKNMGEYISRSYIGNGWVVNFADASAKGGGDAFLIFRYGNAVKSEEMKNYAAYLVENSGKINPDSGRDIFRTLQSLGCADSLSHTQALRTVPLYTWYPDTEFCYMNNDRTGFFLATKGGYNNESHNHNDVGTFSLYQNAQPIIIDAGVGTYTRQTFSSERYTIWTMQSDYHNLPRINGFSQKYGTQYKATEVKFDARRMTFSANIASAYPKEANIQRWIRTYSLTKEGVKIEDTFTLNETLQPAQINFLSWGKIDIATPGEIRMEVNGEKACLSYNKNEFTPSVESIKLTDARLSNVWGKEIYRISLVAKKQSIKGKYVYTIRQAKKGM
ncbi:heparinase II/III family protein [Parabacteroides pacaensis]|uniref:heparinase II/III family protein n=1 Tax=Parabacteroides pacaensis TaxID=2086575 RepID=UPI000D10F9C9|nr:heparinase II/III-family protein [Parabacteroides pacaensis]